ncbi:acyl-CoA dehydrogenase family protein [Mycolicibacter heraklionensis]|nr:acyl-CoA dehydrogenase family protein [Mycolicibacter heraklionensis]
MPAAGLDAARMFAFTDEHDALRGVLRGYFAATADLERGLRWRRLLTEIGLDDLLFNDGGSAVELAILAEESGAALFDGPLLSATVVGPLANAPAFGRVRNGERGVSAAVSLTRVDGERSDHCWDFSDDTVVVGETDGGLVLGTELRALSGLDLSRTMGRGTDVGTPLDCSPETVTAMRRRGDLALSAELLGVAQRALDGTVDYVSQRVQFGRTIGSFQAIKHRLADLLAQVELTRSAVYAAAWQFPDGTAQAELDLAVAAALSRQTAVEMTKAAVQLHGGIAITWEHWAHRYLRRAHAVTALTGTAAHHRSRLVTLIDAGEHPDG